MKLDRTGYLTIIGVMGVALILALLNQMTDVGFGAHVPTYIVALAGKYLCFAMLALAVDLVWGFAGILSLGHAAFFALGGYAMGMYLMRQIGTRGVYGNAALPDFMVFLGWKELPGTVRLRVVRLCHADGDRGAGVLAGVFGWLAFRSRVTGVYLSIITQALTYALLLAFFGNDMGFGGNNGLTDFKDILGFNVQADSTRSALLVVSAAAAVPDVSAGAVRRRLAVRQDPDRGARYREPNAVPGYRPESYKLVVWVLSAVMAGIGARCMCLRSDHQSERVCAGEFYRGGDLGGGGRPRDFGGRDPGDSGDFGKTWLTGRLAAGLVYALGAMFIFGTLFLPRGVMGLFRVRTVEEPETGGAGRSGGA